MKHIRTIALALTILLLSSAAAVAQPDTVLNIYTSVTGIAKDSCVQSITVQSAFGFAPGDRFMIVQMQGALIVEENTENYGAVTDWRGAGNHELGIVERVEGNRIIPKHRLLRNYDPDGKVQLVRVAVIPDNDVITRQVGCPPWDGTIGGVIAIFSPGTISLGADIVADGSGFRGGGRIRDGAVLFAYISDWVGPPDPQRFALKGEGIAGFGVAPNIAGRGAPANGGGGGNNHNAGGGGGGAFGAGGLGGFSYRSSRFAGDYTTTRGIGGGRMMGDLLVMGGGGGAGHDNDNRGTDGARGGGIIVIEATAIIGNGHRISAHGSDAATAGNDGAGGGGGGGTILLHVGSISGSATIDVDGGQGGDAVEAAALEPHGPGGGGGAGTIWVPALPLPAGIIAMTEGGLNGTFAGSSDGALPGGRGRVRPIPSSFDTTDIPNGIDTLARSLTTCETRVQLQSVDHDPSLIAGYRWSPAAGLSATDVADPLATLSDGSNSFYCTVTYRDGCTMVVAVTIEKMAMTEISLPTISTCRPEVQLRAEIPDADKAVSYRWSPAEGLSAADVADPTATVVGTTTWTCTVTYANGCTRNVSVTVEDVGLPDTTLPAIVTCGTRAQLLADVGNPNGIIGYRWTPAEGLSATDVVNPVATVSETTTYTCTITRADSCASRVTVTVERIPMPVIVIAKSVVENAVAVEPTGVAMPRCDSLTLKNTGATPFVFGSGRMYRDVEFSLPPSQIPFVIGPGEERRVEVCYKPSAAERQLDTLILSGECDLMVPIVVQGIMPSGEDDCGNDLRLRTLEAGTIRKSALPYPNPASTAVSIQLRRRSEQEPAPIRCALFDASGNHVGTATLAADESSPDAPDDRDRYTVDVGDLPSGLYYLSVERGGERRVFPVVVAR